MFSLSGTSPAPGENLVSLDTPIEFTIVDDGAGINISTLIVEIGGFRVLNGTDFQDGFDGSNSEIVQSDDDYIIVIDPETDLNLGTVYDVKIQVQDNSGSYFNTTYSFKTIPNEPILISSSPSNHQVLNSAQVIYLEFSDIIDGVDEDSITITINGLSYISNGSIVATENGDLTRITTDDFSVAVRIDPIEPLRNGKYVLEYRVSDPNGYQLIGKINFTVQLREFILPTIFPQTGFLGFFQGIKRVQDIGKGDSLLVQWNTPIKRNYDSDIFVLVYQDPLRLNVFDQPIYLATSEIEEVEINNLVAGETLSFGARALEFPADLFDPNGMEAIKPNFYQLPEPTQITSSVADDDFFIEVESVDGYPDAALLLVGTEVIRYTSVDRVNNRFNIPINGRGLLNSTPGIYTTDDTVELFLKCTDVNTVILMSTPTHQDGYGLDRFVNGEGVVVSDVSDNDRQFFEGFDFCSWRAPRPDQTLNGINDCGSYLGGEFNGLRGFSLFDRMLDNEEVLLNTTGEPVILLKRIWDGITCSCVDPRKVTPKVRSCPNCYSTTYEGGYNQYMNLRRNDRRIMMSFNEAPEDLFYGEKEHLQQDYEPTAWTIPIPAIRDRDMIVRFDLTNDIAFFYEVLNVSREVIFNRRTGRQNISLKRMDKTDIINTFPLDLSRINLTSQ